MNILGADIVPLPDFYYRRGSGMGFGTSLFFDLNPDAAIVCAGRGVVLLMQRNVWNRRRHVQGRMEYSWRMTELRVDKSGELREVCGHIDGHTPDELESIIHESFEYVEPLGYIALSSIRFHDEAGAVSSGGEG